MTIVFWGAVLCFGACLAASLASTHQMTAAAPRYHPTKVPPDIARYPVGSADSAWVRTPGLGLVTVPDFVQCGWSVGAHDRAPLAAGPVSLGRRIALTQDLAMLGWKVKPASPTELLPGPWDPTASAPRCWVQASLQPCAEAAVEHQGLPHGAGQQQGPAFSPLTWVGTVPQGRDEQAQQATGISGSSL